MRFWPNLSLYAGCGHWVSLLPRNEREASSSGGGQITGSCRCGRLLHNKRPSVSEWISVATRYEFAKLRLPRWKIDEIGRALQEKLDLPG